MRFTSETAREAGRKSKRGKDKFSEDIKDLLQLRTEKLLQELDIQTLTSNQKIKVLSIILPYIISKSNTLNIEEEIDLPIFLE
tara:strand:- start:264 stop:512 length:249 start_codon:yes stop_codon:yes gene_type:complete